MSNAHELLCDLGRDVRRLEPSDSDVQAILRRARTGSARQRRDWSIRRVGLATAIAIAALTIAATASVPSTRAAIGDAIDSFFGGNAPGHPVAGEPLSRAEMPAWMRPVTTRAFVIAGTGENRLTAYREQSSGHYCFLYGDGVGECADGEEWGRVLARNPVVLRGPTGGKGATPGHDQPHGGFYGFTRGDVASVRLTFAGGREPISAGARNGGFAMESDLRWKAQRLEALDAAGRVIASVGVTDRFWGEESAP